MHENLIHRYCRAVGSYLPCSPRQKREILLGLRQRLEDHCAEHPESAEDLEAAFGTPQAVAAAYIDDMDTGELLAALRQRGCRVGIVSNKPDATVQRLAERFFPGIPAFGESPACPRKPAPDMVYRALKELGADRGSAVYVGDSEVDAATARNAGVPLIGVSWGFRGRQALEECGVEQIADTAAEVAEFPR